jgi:hypothetical protein
MRPIPLLALLVLAACSGPRGDWRAEFGRPAVEPVVLVPRLPLVVPPVLDLPPPGGDSRADPTD